LLQHDTTVSVKLTSKEIVKLFNDLSYISNKKHCIIVEYSDIKYTRKQFANTLGNKM